MGRRLDCFVMRAFTASVPVWKNLLIPMDALRKQIFWVAGGLCQSLSESRPRAYLLLAITCALIGYLYLLLFPCLVVASALGIYQSVNTGYSVVWDQLIIWLLAGTLSAKISYCIFRLRPLQPDGKVLNSTTHPVLLQLIADQSRYYCGPRVDRIVLSRDFELDVLKIPRFVLPVWSTNTLVVGLPLLQCLSVQQFQCALARRLGQSSKRYNRLGNWLYHLREIWPQYCGLARMCGFGYQPIAWFYCIYAPLYKMITAPAARLDELAADSYAMELFAGEEVLDTITTEMVCRCYLEEKYWPVVTKYAAKDHRILDKLQSGMTSVLRAGLHANTLEHWIMSALSTEEQCGNAMPSLTRRIDNIGFATASMGPLAAVPAAGVYLE